MIRLIGRNICNRFITPGEEFRPFRLFRAFRALLSLHHFLKSAGQVSIELDERLLLFTGALLITKFQTD